MTASNEASSASPWQMLVKAALLGTERQTAGLSLPEGALGSVLSHLPKGSNESSLLASAAALGLYHRAGRKPPKVGASQVTEDTEHDSPRVNAKSGEFLQRLLSGEHRELLPEYLRAVASAGKTVPQQSLPALLELGRQNSVLRPLILPVIGPRGQWLAAQNTDWNYVSGETPDETLWRTGAQAARQLLFQRLRQTNPAGARSLLDSTWANEPAADRSAFIASFAANLSMEDEPFLEKALDDRAKEVRKNAADLLARLPDSALSKRMAEHTFSLLAWKPGRRPRIDVTLPDEIDSAAQRDGIDSSAQRQGVGKKAWWLYQIVSLTSPGAFNGRWGATPAEILAAEIDKDWRDLLLEAWTAAAARHREPAWAEALWTQDLKGGVEMSPWDAYAMLAPALPESKREQFMAGRVRRDPNLGGDTSDVPQMLRAYDQSWGKVLTRAVMELLRKLVLEPDARGRYRLRSALPDFARRMPPDMIAELTSGWPANAPSWDAWKEPIEQFLSIVQFRHDMLEAINTA